MTTRLAHISDLHIPVKPLGWGWRDLFTKRATGWVNVRLLGRGQRFKQAPAVLQKLMHSLRENQIQHVLFSGDASMFGFRREFEEVAQLLQLDSPDALPGLAVPGNHDYYIRRNHRLKDFELAFQPWQQGIRLDQSQVYPFAQKIDDLWFIGVNSARSNLLAFDARGGVGKAQRERLKQLLASLGTGRKIIVTHYPLLLASGKPETRFRRMRDWKEMRALCIEAGISLWLHGHRHHGYILPASTELPFPCICVGSSTQTNRWTYHEYRFEADLLTVIQRRYDPDSGQFREGETIRVELPGREGETMNRCPDGIN